VNPAVIALLICLGLAGSIALLVSALIGSTGEPTTQSAFAQRLRRWTAGRDRSRGERIAQRIRIAAVCAVGVAIWVITGIPSLHLSSLPRHSGCRGYGKSAATASSRSNVSKRLKLGPDTSAVGSRSASD
jgi:hypothetical protein